MTKAEQERTERMMRLGCVACAHLGLPGIAHENHHILSGGLEDTAPKIAQGFDAALVVPRGTLGKLCAIAVIPALVLLIAVIGGCATTDQPPPPIQTSDCPLDVNPNWPCQVRYP